MRAVYQRLKLPYEGKDPGVPSRRGRPYLHRNLSDTGIDRIKKAREVAHDTLNQQPFYPVCKPVGEKSHKLNP